MDSHPSESYSIAEARDQLPALIHRAETTGNIQLTRRGKPVAMLLSVAEYRRLAEKNSDWWTAVQTQRHSGWLTGEGWTPQEFEGLRSGDLGRPVDL